MKDKVYGQQKIKDLFLRSLKNDTLGHCYILEGEEGMGKKTLADLIALMIVCEEHNACGKCKGCIMAKADSHPDISYVVPYEDKKNIGVDVIRDMIQKVYVRPYVAEKKVVIINNFELALPPAQNAILKVLEEPPEYVCFICTVSHNKNLLDTVKSRAVMLKLQPYLEKEINDFLNDNVKADNEETKKVIAAFCNGNTGKALKLTQNEAFMQIRAKTFDALFMLIENKSRTGLSELCDKSMQPFIREIAECIISFLRDMLLYKWGLFNLIVNADYGDKIQNISKKTESLKIINAMQEVLALEGNLQRNINYNLAVTSSMFGSLEEING